MVYYNNLLEPLLKMSNEGKGIKIIKSLDNEKYISYNTLLRRSLFVYNKLKDMGVHRGTQIVIQCMDSENFIYVFWACIMGGFVAVPVDINNNEYKKGMNESLFHKLDNPFLLCDTTDKSDMFDSVFEGKAMDLSIIDYSSIDYASNIDIDYSSETDDIVYILFSSGSTGTSKGVTITSSNIIADISGIIERLEMTPEDVFLSWQPLTHCYGLIVFHVLPILLGASQYLIPTEVFIRHPLLWLEMANKYKITRLGTIPYALKHFVDVYQKSDRMFGWDLSGVKSIMIGAEQVTIELCKDFTSLMKKYSLHENVMAPLYGLTETVVIVGLQSLLTPLKSHKIMRDNLEIGKEVVYLDGDVSNLGASFLEIGKPICNVKVKITDDDFNELPENVIGHICAKGNIVTAGYFKDEETTNSLFKVDGWLDTGDIGFVVDEKLVVAGRVKELVIIGGRKYSCIYIEDMINRKVNKEGFGQVVACSGLDSRKSLEQTAIFVQCSADFNDDKFKQRFSELDRDIRKVLFDVIGVSIDYVIPVEVIPKTFSGKTRRVNLMTRFLNGEFKVPTNILSESNENSTQIVSGLIKSELKIKAAIAEIVTNILQVKITDYEAPFKDYGIVSINIPYFIDEVNKTFKLKLEPSSIFNYTNINQLTKYIYKTVNENYTGQGEIMEKESKKVVDDNKIAIIGMSCHFPGGANSIDEYWKVMMEGIDGICDVPKSRWKLEKYYDEDENNPGKMYCKKGGFLKVPIDQFDARFFNISPKEATALDPQQRLVLELTWEAFENANLKITDYNGSNTGVYLGMSTDEYAMAHLYSGDLSRIDAYSLTGMCKSTACGRISYTFGFEGPSVAVDTACSSSLTAMHFACNALKAGETNLAVVAGVNLIITPATNVGFSKLRATSVDGHSKSFDESANGYGRSEGAGVLIFKKLSEAVRDGDTIWAVVCGTAVNQDGRSNGLTAPNGISQARLIQSALNISNLQPTDISYVEMHGTGTKLGDPIEVNAVMDTYCQGRSKDNPLKIGSVKSNIGHLEAGAGIASIIKVMLSMKNGLIPANLYFNTPNRFINWDRAPIGVIGEHTKWDNTECIRRAGINGFGFGGSNAHVILEEYIPEEYIPQEKQGINYILKLSAKTENSLKEYIGKFIEYIKASDEEVFGDILYTANRCRTDFECRFAVTGASRNDILQKMEDYLAGEATEGVYCSMDENNSFNKDRKLVFMFTGQGSQYVNMGKSLFDSNSIFRESMLLCDRMFKPYILKSIIELLYSESASNEVIARTVYAQPLIFAIEYSLYKTLESMGIVPEIVMGHSIGEYPAAVVSGIMNLEDAVKLVSIRGRLMDSAPGSGSMATIFATEDIVNSLIKDYVATVSLAALNARESCMISGVSSDVEEIVKLAEEKGYSTRTLKVSHAFHSVLMKPILEDFNGIAKEVSYSAPKTRFVSALYARELSENEIIDHDYWTRHIMERVDFYNAISSIKNPQDYVLLEIGSTRVLSALCRLIFGESGIVENTLNMKKEDTKQLAETIARIYVTGVDVDWTSIDFAGKTMGTKPLLPNYPFDKAKFWTEPLYDRSGFSAASDDEYHKLLGQKIESPFMEKTVVFQSRFTGTTPYFMGEHIIFDTPISPAAAHISMLLSTAKELKNPLCAVVKEIELRAPLAIYNDEERTVQICVTENEENETSYSIVSKERNTANEKWITHSQGKLAFNDEYFKSEVVFDKETLSTIKFDNDAEEVLYDSMRSTGFDLGEGFRRITKNYCNNENGICYIQPLMTVPDIDMYTLYPGVIDSLLQTMLCVEYKKLKAKGIPANQKTIIPYYIGSVTYNYRPSENLWCYIKISDNEDTLYGEVTAFNEKGEAVICIKDFMAKFTTRDILLSGTKNSLKGMYYHTEWIKSKNSEKDKKLNKPTKYIVISNNENKANELCEELLDRNASASAVSVISKDSYAKVNEKMYTVNSCEESSWTKLIEDISANNENADYKFIYFNATAPNTVNGENKLEAVSYNNLKGLLSLVRAIGKSSMESKSKIKIVTQNVQDIGGVSSINLTDATVWGFAKVFSIEFSKMFDGIIDIDVTCKNSLLAAELIGGITEEVCLRGENERYVSRLIKDSEYLNMGHEKLEKVTISEDAAYLITGGTGALGLVYADYLVSQGAKNILLMSRRTPSEGARKKIDEIKASGVRIETIYADVSDSESVENALGEISGSFPEIRGVIHAAGTLRDKMILDADWEEFENVLNPKVAGTINVYNALNKEKLDFFVMLSSITSVVGNMGQSNYASANYFLNRFAAWLGSKKLKGLTFCWGPWQQGGMLSDNEAAATNLSILGIRKFTPEMGIKIIAEYFEQPYENLLIADIDWKALSQNFSGSGKKEFMSKITESYKTNEKAKDVQLESAIIEELAALPRKERKELLIGKMQQVCGKIMGFAAGQLPDTELSFREQGADSLMLFSIRSSINKMLKVELDISTLYNYSTLTKLAEYLLDEVLFKEKEEALSEVAATSTESLLEELERLTEE